MAGKEFVQKIRPVGCFLFIALFVLVTSICLTSGRDPIPGFSAAHDTQYYSLHPDELVSELQTDVFPSLDGVEGCYIEGGSVVVEIDGGSFAVVRAAILRYFDASLFDFRQIAASEVESGAPQTPST